ncbi:lysophospholipid hydrolase [Nematocida sp. AWRm80]|nr:lysophospholipid hydrolase [Nematocida sp. AWRm80]
MDESIIKEIKNHSSTAYGVIGILTALVAIYLTYLYFRRKTAQETEIRQTEIVTEPIDTKSEGIISLFTEEQKVFGQPVTTTMDISVETGETLYYLISGTVEIYLNNQLVGVKNKNYFLYMTEWLINPSAKSLLLYTIKAKSMLYQINTPIQNTSITGVLFNRFLRSTLYTCYNYLEIPPGKVDIRRISIIVSTDKEKIMEEIKKTLSLKREVLQIERVSSVDKFTSNQLYLITSGSAVVSYYSTYLHPLDKVEVQEGDLIGYLNSVCSLGLVRKVSGEFKAIKVQMDPLSTAPNETIGTAVKEIFQSHDRADKDSTITKEEFSLMTQLSDALLDWRVVQPGERIGTTNSISNVTIVCNGYFVKENSIKYFGIGPGRILFEKEAILGETGTYTATSTRLSEVIEIPAEYIAETNKQFPRVSSRLYKRLLSRTATEQELDRPAIITFVTNNPLETQIEMFTYFLSVEMNKHSTSTVLTSDILELSIDSSMDRPLSILALLQVVTFLQEEYSQILLSVVVNDVYRINYLENLSDIIFYLAENGDQRELSLKKVWCKLDTVILHRNSTRNVLEGRYYGQRHHVEFPFIDVPVQAIRNRMNNKQNTSQRIRCTNDSYHSPEFPIFPLEDLKRFIRTLKGTNVGLVLGGGGARGIAHIGIIQALEEAGIPIDAIGGTSMGAFVGALYAIRGSNKDAFNKSKKLSMLIGSIWRVLLDITYPVCSMFTGKSFNWGLKLIFKAKKIEDLWLPYYCITTDIAAFEEKVHTFGPLWKYVRASMGLAGYVPPVCDKGSFLLDGGYVNNVPADTMRSIGIRNIIAVDVGSEVQNDYDDYGDSVNGFYILFQKIFGTKKFFSLTEIQYRLAYITSVTKERTFKSDLSIKYIKPNLSGYKTMNFRQFDEIVAHGYQQGKKIVAEWKKTGEYTSLINPSVTKHQTTQSILTI